MAKVEIVETPKEETFEPITFQITIESADEFREMWHRMNLNTDEVIAKSKDGYSPVYYKNFSEGSPEGCSISDAIWELLDEYNEKQKKCESDCYIHHVTYDTSSDPL